jgi:hypothetical protein
VLHDENDFTGEFVPPLLAAAAYARMKTAPAFAPPFFAGRFGHIISGASVSAVPKETLSGPAKRKAERSRRPPQSGFKKNTGGLFNNIKRKPLPVIRKGRE